MVCKGGEKNRWEVNICVSNVSVESTDGFVDSTDQSRLTPSPSLMNKRWGMSWNWNLLGELWHMVRYERQPTVGK